MRLAGQAMTQRGEWKRARPEEAGSRSLHDDARLRIKRAERLVEQRVAALKARAGA